MQSARIASYPCRIERGAPDWTVSFRDVPQALVAGRGVPEIFEVAESALVTALGDHCANAAGGLPAASAPAPGEVVITVRVGGPPLVRTSAPPSGSVDDEPDASDDIPAISGEVVDVPSETGLVPVRRQGFWGWLAGLFTGSRSS
jgi:hypothetical protein